MVCKAELLVERYDHTNANGSNTTYISNSLLAVFQCATNLSFLNEIHEETHCIAQEIRELLTSK